MTTDSTIQELTYRYFLQEALELLQVIEQELLSLREGYSINKVHTLMRATHTLKGAAASVGLETIKTVAHLLEDVFRAICKPDVVIDPEVEALLFEGYECLRLPLTAELAGGSINHSEVIDRIHTIFAQLQEKFGDCLGEATHIPTSEELGFDITQSIFEVGVTQRLDQLATAIATGDPQQITHTLRTQAEVFLGLAESLNLTGLKAIAQTAIAALNMHPEQVVTVACVALANFQEARIAVLNGDRSQGGQLSLALQQLSGQETEKLKLAFEPTNDDVLIDAQSSAEQLQLTWATDAIKSQSTVVEPHTEEAFNQQGQAPPNPSDPEKETSFVESIYFPTSRSSSPTVPATHSVRVNVEHLEQLNYFIGELLTNHNHQSLQNEQLWTTIQRLLTRLQQHQEQLNQLQDWIDRQFKLIQQQPDSNGAKTGYFDPLEITHNDKPQSLIQSILEDVVQLGETADAVEMFARHSQETLDKQRRLLTSTRDALIEARMLPLGHLFERFPRILRQLKTMYKKQVDLEFCGSETLVDKAVVEKLYDPLLHLLRNAFDHGIESPTIRKQQNKPEQGRITINAYHQGKYLMVEVQDDGQGLDFEQIRAKAVERQFVSPEQASQLDTVQLSDILFEPGFSTVSQVNELSGRGIGLDVVRTHLQTLQGTISVDSKPHQGTIFRLQIPLSLTIAKLLLCQSHNQVYAFFVNAIEEILIPVPEQVRCWESGKVLRWVSGNTEQLIPLYSLTKVLNYNQSLSKPSISQTPYYSSSENHQLPTILIHTHDQVIGLEVDQLLGEQELVIRPLGAMIVPPRYIYGSSILPNGQLTLVLDGAALIEYLSEQKNNSNINYNLTHTAPLLLASRLEQPTRPVESRAALPGSPYLEGTPEAVFKTILLVDDSITVRQTLALTLHKAGYQVLQAKDGYEALEQLQYQKDIDLVFCDIEMPRMDGFEFLRNRQQNPELVSIPVVMLSSRSSEKHRAMAFYLGASAYITKPYLEHMLLATLTDVLDRNNS